MIMSVKVDIQKAEIKKAKTGNPVIVSDNRNRDITLADVLTD